MDKILQSCQVNVDEDHPSYPKNAMHVYAQNEPAMIRNDKMLMDLEGTMYISKARDFKKDVQANIAAVKFSQNPKEYGNLLGVLGIKIGARVMLTLNVDVTDGLTNGAMGTVSNVVQKGDKISVILVQFDNPTVDQRAIARSQFKDIDSSPVPFYEFQKTFPINEKSFQGCRIQFPLFLSWAVSIHKCQGLTVDEIVVDMSRHKGPYQRGQAYVAFSRVKTLEKLHIINYCRKQIKVSPDVSEEMEQLRRHCIPPIPEPKVRHIDQNKSVAIAHLNVRNLMAKRYDITCDTDICRAGVICFTESHLSANDKLTPSVIGLCNNTEIYHCDRDNNGGGVVICVDSKYHPTVLCVGESGLELVGIQINIPDRVNIFCTYRPPTYNCETFLQKLCNVLDHYADNPLCIVGDFNEDILENSEKVIHKTFLNAGFTQYVKVPTRDSGTLFDHVYTGHIQDVETEVCDTYYSDHDAVYCYIQAC